MNTVHHSTTSTDLIETMRMEIHQLQAEIERLRVENRRRGWSMYLEMFNQNGLHDAVAELPPAEYVVVFADIDQMKALNTATGSHLETDKILAKALKVREGETASHFMGDEFIFIIRGNARAARGFIARKRNQLASVELPPAVATKWYTLTGRTHLSATFTFRVVPQAQILSAIYDVSADVLAQKALRDNGGRA